MSGYDLYRELQSKSRQLDTMVDMLRSGGIDCAQTERDYKVLLRKECLKLRDKGEAVGMIDKICYGIPSVAEARFERDAAEAVYKANLEAIQATKLQMRLIEAQIEREWGRET